MANLCISGALCTAPTDALNAIRNSLNNCYGHSVILIVCNRLPGHNTVIQAEMKEFPAVTR